MKKFDVPSFYKSQLISKIKNIRRLKDPKKKNFDPTIINFSKFTIIIPRHFGFCYGVENAIEIAYKTLAENPDKRIFLLSEMIHNPDVNEDLIAKGVKFIMTSNGQQLIDWNEINENDIVIIPAFGTSLEIENILTKKNISTEKYNTTCPFVEKVWNRASAIAKEGYTIIIHGKYYHEETKATFSRSSRQSKSLIIRDLNEAKFIEKFLFNEISENEFLKIFDGKYSQDFLPTRDLQKIGIVNQTTMLASETQEISNYLRNVYFNRFGAENLKERFADTRDTLCYATNDNQTAVIEALKTKPDISIVIGGYNSSNTTGLARICSQYSKTYYISNPEKIINNNSIYSFDIEEKKEKIFDNFLSDFYNPKILIVTGASCPDILVELTIKKILNLYNIEEELESLYDKIEEII